MFDKSLHQNAMFKRRRLFGLCRHCPSCIAKSSRVYCGLCLRKLEYRNRDRISKLRVEVINKYGGRCGCCGESDFRLLTLDHVNGGGRAERESIGTSGIYYKVRRLGYPPEYRILCRNCNCGIFANGGICPHVDPHNWKNHNVAYSQRWRNKLRGEWLTAFGGKCESCGESRRAFLCLDHKLDDGAKERRRIVGSNRYGTGTVKILVRLKKLGWPKDRYQILCHNCNHVKWMESQ